MFGEQVDTDDFDRDAREQSEARVVNISDEIIRFEIAQQPGSKPRRYTLAPYGAPGDSIHIQIGYTQPFKGAGRGMVRPTIEAMTEREIVSEIPPTQNDPGRPAVRVPLVVHEERVDEARGAYIAAMKKAGKVPRGVRAERVARANSKTPMASTAKPEPDDDAVLDEEGQDGPLDEPPPDDDMPPVMVGGKSE